MNTYRGVREPLILFLSLFLLNFLLILDFVDFVMKDSYRESLEGDVRRRYEEKIGDIGKDPYEIEKREFTKDKKFWPHVNSVDLFDFLILRESFYTSDELRSYKALEAFRLFQDGWIKEILHMELNSCHLLKAKVNHSMRIREKPLEPWVIISSRGVDSAHCTCMAGLGEACSHISAVLFALEAWTKVRKEASVTDVPAYWMMPSSVQLEHPYKRIRDMDFQSANKKRRESSAPVHPRKDPNNIPSPTKREVEEVYSTLLKKGSAVALSVSKDHAANFKPKTLEGDWPVDLKSVRNDSLRDASYEEILKHADSVTITVTPSQASFVETVTREQTKSAKWGQYRVGRITASRIYQATHTTTETPSRSLVKDICKPTPFKSVHTDWGIRKEPAAKKAYKNQMIQQHSNFTMKDSGLVLHPDYPEFGASPDALVSCSCCGSGLLEVKCPSSLKDSHKIDMPYLKDKKLKRETKYFYQVQMQLFLTDRKYCDFFIWTPHATLCERITRDTKLWEDMCCKGQNFHRRVIMPELICSFFSRTATETDGNSYCVCGSGDDGRKMIACDGENCVTVWFHMSCLRIKRVPKGKWLCEKCR